MASHKSSYALCRHNSAKPISFDDDDDDFDDDFDASFFLFDGAIFFSIYKEAYATVTLVVLFFQPKRHPSLRSSSLSSVREYYYLYVLLYVHICIYISCVMMI